MGSCDIIVEEMGAVVQGIMILLLDRNVMLLNSKWGELLLIA
jgi:hypothetical protein